MYLTKRQRLLAVIDPSVAERERRDAAAYRQRELLARQVERAAAWIVILERRVADGERVRKAALAKARHNLDHFTAAAERAGLLRSRKETAQ